MIISFTSMFYKYYWGNNMDNKPGKDTKDNITLGISIGVLVGVALGCWLDNLALWMSVGALVGICIGSKIQS